MTKAIKTIKKYEKYMINSIKYPYSNGILEGINNKIKIIKRVSYGYASFYNFRLRILIVFRLFEDVSKQNKKIKK
ncbi:MAG: transposase [Gemella sp.]|nr:transposase [Gemella sp.]